MKIFVSWTSIKYYKWYQWNEIKYWIFYFKKFKYFFGGIGRIFGVYVQVVKNGSDPEGRALHSQ